MKRNKWQHIFWGCCGNTLELLSEDLDSSLSSATNNFCGLVEINFGLRQLALVISKISALKFCNSVKVNIRGLWYPSVSKSLPTFNSDMHRQRDFILTLMPSNRDRALRGLKALNVRRDLMAPSSE